MNKPVIFILNPAADCGRTKEKFRHLEERAKYLFSHVKIWETTHEGHAKILAEQAVQEDCLLVAIGGDGTFNEVVNGCLNEVGELRAEGAQLGFIPSGTGNDFCRGLGTPSELSSLLLQFKEGRIRRIDVGRATAINSEGRKASRYFLNAASMGISTTVLEILKKKPYEGLGRFAYLWATVKALYRYQPQSVRFQIGKEAFSLPALSLLAFCNGQYVGGGMRMAPRARMDDGWLEQIGICRFNLWFLIRHGLSVYNGKHLRLPQISARRTRSTWVEAASLPITVETDGELLGQLPAHFEVLPSVLPVVA